MPTLSVLPEPSPGGSETDFDAPGNDRPLDDAHARFLQLARRDLDRAYRLAGLILGDALEAEDAVQDALLRAWRSAGTVRDLEGFQAWFDQILVNGCRDRLRRRRTITSSRSARASIRPSPLIHSAPLPNGMPCSAAHRPRSRRACGHRPPLLGGSLPRPDRRPDRYSARDRQVPPASGAKAPPNRARTHRIDDRHAPHRRTEPRGPGARRMSDEMFDQRLRNALHGSSLPAAPASLRSALDDLPRTARGTTDRSVPRRTAGAALAAGLAAVAVLGGAAVFGLGGFGPAGETTPTPSPSPSARHRRARRLPRFRRRSTC